MLSNSLATVSSLKTEHQTDHLTKNWKMKTLIAQQFYRKLNPYLIQ